MRFRHLVYDNAAPKRLGAQQSPVRHLLARPRNEDFGYRHKSEHRDGQPDR
jgi:hypothetical protein